MSSAIYAVLIADVMASSVRKDVRALLGKRLAAASEKHLRQKLICLPYTVTAGDEFQTITGELSSLEQTAKRLKLDVSTVSRNLKRGYYWQLIETVKVAGALIGRTFS